MSDFADMRAEFVDAFADAGLWSPAQVKSGGRTATVQVGYRQPTENIFGQQASQQHAIDYRASDLPKLAEGDPVSFLDDDGAVIKTRRFKVREAPFVPGDAIAGTQGDGFWKRALLTQL